MGRFQLAIAGGAGAQVVADLVLKVAQRKQRAQGVSYDETWLLRDLEDKVCYYLPTSESNKQPKVE